MQNEELSYAIVTPYSMRKSRTGGIIARLISRTGLDLVAARMFAPSEELAKRYAGNDRDRNGCAASRHPGIDPRLCPEEFYRQGERPESRACCSWFFAAPDAVEKMHDAVGHIVHERTSGETIRDTFGDYITDDAGKVTYFEPAVLAAFDPKAVERDLKLWAEFSDRDGGILDQVIEFPKGAKVEKTLVLIKPDNFKFPNLRPGGVIEVFSRTGLYIIGFKVHRMSVAQAEEFYGPVLPVLEEKLGPRKGATPGKTSSRSWPAESRADPRRQTRRARHREMHRHRLPGRRRGAKNPRRPRPDRSRQGATGLDPQGIRPERSWSTPPTLPIRPRTPSARWRSFRWTRIISNL